ncbi:MAG: MAPEG family protein [Bdellovibrionaceae bacterium]|nr:MAPEG family protein [Pseudobdellovibrionaceae bacterium]
MTTELYVLSFAAILGLIQLMIATQLSTGQRGVKWNLSPRDQKMPELTGVAGRMDRAYKNFMETFAIFVAAIAVVHLANRLGPISTLGAELYLAARVLYVPVYAAGIPVVRTLIWLVSLIGIAMVLYAGLVS